MDDTSYACHVCRILDLSSIYGGIPEGFMELGNKYLKVKNMWHMTLVPACQNAYALILFT